MIFNSLLLSSLLVVIWSNSLLQSFYQLQPFPFPLFYANIMLWRTIHPEQPDFTVDFWVRHYVCEESQGKGWYS